MRDIGVVCEGTHEGREVLGIRVTWDKALHLAGS